MNTFHKSQRLTSFSEIETLFSGNGKSFSIYPIRLIYCKSERQESGIKLLISVSKRHFHNAVDRNRVKRQIREAFRLNCHQLNDNVANRNLSLNVALLWMSDKIETSAVVHATISKLLERLVERL